ncbi:MAG: chemotaxis protein [Vibrio sp.]
MEISQRMDAVVKKWQTISMRFIFIFITLLSLNACSLIEIDSQTVPLTEQELNMRVLNREYAQKMFSQIERSGRNLEGQIDPDDNDAQSYVLLWKIHASEGIKKATYQVSPVGALIDTWVFTDQMTDYFTRLKQNDPALDLNTPQALVDEGFKVSQDYSKQIEQFAREILTPERYLTTRAFVTSFVREHQFEDLSFITTPAYKAWLDSQGIEEKSALKSIGTLPEALGDMSDRLSLTSDMSPKLITWKAQLIARNSALTRKQMSQTLDNINATASSMQAFVNNNPEYMREMMATIREELGPVIDDIDQRTDKKLDKLAEQRQGLNDLVERERMALADLIERERESVDVMINDQRELLMQDIHGLSDSMVEKVISELGKVLNSVLFYLIIFMLLTFFVPFGLGFVLGRRKGQGSQTQTEAQLAILTEKMARIEQQQPKD